MTYQTCSVFGDTDQALILEEIDRFEAAVNDFFAGKLDADRFTAIRLQQGVYGQRQLGVNMIRAKLPGGNIKTYQLKAIADLIETFSQHNIAHVTTRQDIQVHYIPLERIPEALRLLARANLTSREACANTVRNVTACPLAGVCPKEHTDVNQHLKQAVLHFMRHPITQQMPRKFKMSFSGCETDCAQGLLHDLAVIATKKAGQNGFKILAGGGLGHKPRHAITVEEFIPERELIPAIEAIITVHHRYSDRTKRAKSRIKFLVDKFGKEGFIEKYQEALAHVRPAFDNETQYPVLKAIWQETHHLPEFTLKEGTTGAPRDILPQKQIGFVLFPISLKIGDIPADQLRALVNVLEKHHLDDVRATQDQNLVILNVPFDEVEPLRADLAAIGLHTPQTGDNVVSCPGTSTCRLGITSSQAVALKLSGGKHDLRIRVSGCQNGCAQPETGDIGIYGEGKRYHGRLVPHYQLYLGGDGRTQGGLAIKGPVVPSARVDKALDRIQSIYETTRQEQESFFAWAHRQEEKYFHGLLEDLIRVEPEDMTEVMRDHGSEDDFKVLQLGGGECAGAVQVQVSPYFFEIKHEWRYRNAFLGLNRAEAALESAKVQANLLIQGLNVMFKNNRPAELDAFLAQVEAWQQQPIALTEKTQLSQAFAALDALILQGAALCTAHDPQLDLTDALPA